MSAELERIVTAKLEEVYSQLKLCRWCGTPIQFCRGHNTRYCDDNCAKAAYRLRRRMKLAKGKGGL